MSRRGFTLIELLVVVVVLTILMTIIFKLIKPGVNATARAETLSRLHRIENAFSGYYAAFGTYPPVKCHGSQNPYAALENGSTCVQSRSGQLNTDIWGWYSGSRDKVTNPTKEKNAWYQVEAACRAQPFGLACPMPSGWSDYVKARSEAYKEAVAVSQFAPESVRREAAAGFDDGVSSNIGRHRANRDKVAWEDIQLFRFGALSYLLPRYMIMMNGDDTFFRDYAQWTGNNILPADPFSGNPMRSWSDVQNYATSSSALDLARVSNVPSQAVCARWIANFEKLLSSNVPIKLFGVQVTVGTMKSTGHDNIPTWTEGETAETSGRGWGKIYYPISGSYSGGYVLNELSIADGWGNEFYYHSPPPYQGYILWSAGANGRTFPPWIERASLPSDANTCIGYWIRDDLVGIRH